MKQYLWQLLLFILLGMTIYVLFNPTMYNSILGRTILVSSVIVSTSYNFMIGLGVLTLIIYTYPATTYMEGLTGLNKYNYNPHKSHHKNDRISKEEKLRPKTTHLYQSGVTPVSTNYYNEPMAQGSNNLGFAFLS